LQDTLAELQRGRNERNVQILDALHANGVDVTAGELAAEAGPGSVGRPSLARILVRKGYVSTIQEAFDVWLAKGAPAYFERPRLTPEDAIRLTHESGGVCAVAHPLSLGLEGDDLDTFVGELRDAGLDGLECEYSAYAPEERTPLHALAARHDLAPTGGSDYHGENKPGLQVGVGRGDLRVPDEYLSELEARRR
jgi:predicted metal-dependent phosphoesterase TrpH